MAKPQEVDWREPPPKGKGGHGKWEATLKPLVRHPGRWAMIFRAKTPLQAQQTRENLNQRKVNIPLPDDDWGFAAREQEVFAIYRGKAKNARVRRAKRQG
jgi:hypothetical protein